MPTPTAHESHSPADEPAGATVTLQVELTHVQDIEIELPEGVTLDDLSSKRLHRWPDAVLKAIRTEIEGELTGRSLSDISESIAEVASEDPDLDIAATW